MELGAFTVAGRHASSSRMVSLDAVSSMGEDEPSDHDEAPQEEQQLAKDPTQAIDSDHVNKIVEGWIFFRL